MRTIGLYLSAVLICVPTAAAAQSMNAEAFYERASALQRQGPFALFSKDASLLMAEGKASGQKARQQRQAAIAAGANPRFCPPSDKVRIGSDEFMKRLGAIPAAQRRSIDMTEATTRILAAKFPC